MMASLPSVVLGFLAALVIAPFVEHWLPAVLASFFCIPGSFLLVAYLCQLLPEKTVLWLARWRVLFIASVLPLGIVLSVLVGPWMETILFAGDLKKWLTDRNFGTSIPGWFLMMLPVSLLVKAFLQVQLVNSHFRRLTRDWNRFDTAFADLVKFLAGTVVTVGLALGLAAMLNALGFDPRGSVLGTYIQRNALVVGFMMGFAIIPIIYTISEDALSSVPEHLRSASLGCGATSWQTASRIIIPTAMSGLFSAVMVGLGRAVGETMIVLMATGNTPILDLNMFNGFQTLSAAIATELPEASKDTTHYRTLFLAGLVLFAMTFVLNTFAEVIRQRFRRRAYQL
jgi:phosphate transport system permease protein